MNFVKRRVIKLAADNAVKQTAAAHCPVGKIAAGAVRGSILGAREHGWDDPEGVTVAMSGVMQSSVEILQSIYSEPERFLDTLSNVCKDAMRMALDVNADSSAAATGAVLGAMRAVRKVRGVKLPSGMTAVASGLVHGAVQHDVTDVGPVIRGVVQGAVIQTAKLDCSENSLTLVAVKGILKVSAELGGDALRQALDELNELPGVLPNRLH